MKSVLVVEDSSLVREIAVRISRDLGLSAHEATDPAQAIETCRTEKPDAVLLDWDLPSLGALDVLHGVGGIASEERPVIILLATENDPQQFTLAKAAGAAFHILKPFTKDTLADAFAKAGLLEARDTQADRAVS